MYRDCRPFQFFSSKIRRYELYLLILLNLGTKTLEFNNHITVHPALLCFDHCIFSIQKNIKRYRKSIRESD